MNALDPSLIWHTSSTKLGKAMDIGAADNSNIALVHGPADGGPENFRDIAQMIVAAPKMLRALKMILERCPIGSVVEEIAEAAIAEAVEQRMQKKVRE